QARTVAAAANPSDEVRALRHARVELTRNAVVAEVVAKQLCRLRLVAGRVRGVETDELLQELGHLVAQRDRRHQRCVPSTRRYSRVCAISPSARYSFSKKSTHVWCSSSRRSPSDSASTFVGP